MVSLNRGFTYREQLGAMAVGQTALDYLAQRYRHSSRERWAERLCAGEVQLEDKVIGPDDLLKAGQYLCWHRPPWTEPAVPLDYEIVFEDDVLLVVHKPAGLPTLPAGGFLANTLLSLIQHRDPTWTPMHRLGRGTSGLVVFARTPAARANLQAAWRTHSVEKRYLALANGNLQAPQWIRAPIGELPHPRLGTLHAYHPGGKPSESLVEAAVPSGDHTRATIRIFTGRPHQIRIHLAYLGHPLVGDPLYGPGGLPRGTLPALPGDLGYQLHAWRLAFPHPGTGRRLELEATVPAELRGSE